MPGSPNRPATATHHVVVVGGGFGGLYLVQSLRRAPVGVTLIDRRNFHLFQPLLYQVATGGLSPANIAAPLRAVLKRQRNARVLLGEVHDINPHAREVFIDDQTLPYDTLVVASGVRHNYFGHDEWQHAAPGLKTIEDATEIRRRVLLAFETAERQPDPAKVRAWLTFVVVGGGPTGLELAGTLAEVARHTLRQDFRTINPAMARIILVEATQRLLPTFPPDLSAKAARQLEKLGGTVRTRTLVTDVQPGHVQLQSGDELETLETHTVLWSAGVQGSRLGRVLHDRTGVALDRAGRVLVEPDCTIRGADDRTYPEIFVIGDLALLRGPDGQPLPGIAPVAMQQGDFVAGVIRRRLAGAAADDRRPFVYHHRGSMATIGRAAAVAHIGRWRFAGYVAWLLWLFVHLAFLIEFQNRVLVLLQWAWNYVTWNRSARLITGEPGAAAPHREERPPRETAAVGSSRH